MRFDLQAHIRNCREFPETRQEAKLIGNPDKNFSLTRGFRDAVVFSIIKPDMARRAFKRRSHETAAKSS